MRGPDSETLWNNTSRGVPNVKNPKQTSHKEKHPYNVSMYQQEKAHFNMYQWILSQTCPGQRVLTAYLQSLTKDVPKQPNSSPATKQSMGQVSPKNTSDI